MTSKVCFTPARAALGAALLALAASPTTARATPEFRVPVVVCVPADTQSMAHEMKLALTGVVRQAGRNPPPRAYFCPVFNPDFTTSVPTWNKLKLVYEDTTGLNRNIAVRLYQKGLNGTTVLASVSSVAAAGIHIVSAVIPSPLDFSRYSYYMTVEMARPALTVPDVVDVHELQLTH